jgi:putative salt-induced outer membrane protein
VKGSVAAALTASCFLAAAIAATADDPPPSPPPPVWSGKSEVSYVGTSGNTDTSTIGGAAEALYQPGRWSGLARAAFVRSATDDEVKAKSLVALLRGARRLKPRLEGYAQAGYLRDTFAGIRSRIAPEAGLAYELVARAAHSLKTEAGIGYTRESRLAGPDLSFATGRGGLSYRWKISSSAELSDDVSYTQNLQDGPDWRVGQLFSIATAVKGRFSLKVSHGVAHLNRPVAGFKKTDTMLAAAMVAKF